VWQGKPSHAYLSEIERSFVWQGKPSHAFPYTDGQVRCCRCGSPMSGHCVILSGARQTATPAGARNAWRAQRRISAWVHGGAARCFAPPASGIQRQKQACVWPARLSMTQTLQGHSFACRPRSSQYNPICPRLKAGTQRGFVGENGRAFAPGRLCRRGLPPVGASSAALLNTAGIRFAQRKNRHLARTQQRRATPKHRPVTRSPNSYQHPRATAVQRSAFSVHLAPAASAISRSTTRTTRSSRRSTVNSAGSTCIWVVSPGAPPFSPPW
jgi:hypothetical protein